MMYRVFFVVIVAVLGFASPIFGQAQVTAVVGSDVAINMGERPGVLFGIRAEKKGELITLENYTFFDTSKKVQGPNNFGWKTGTNTSLRIGRTFGAVVGADYRHRNGGVWTKDVVWATLGGGWRKDSKELRLLYRHPVFDTGENFSQIVQGEWRMQPTGSRFGITLVQGLLWHQTRDGTPQPVAWFQMASLTVRLSGQGGAR